MTATPETGAAPATVTGRRAGEDVEPLRVDVIVVAAGASRRMGGIDKLAWSLAGEPLLAHTLRAVATSPLVDRIVLVSAPERVEALRGEPWLPTSVAAVVPGGADRHGSVAAGLAAVEARDRSGDRVVLVHDGARPLVSLDLIAAVARATARYGAAIPALPVADTVKRVEGGQVLATIARDALMTAQTPQGATLGSLRRAFADPVAAKGGWTDEAALLEACRIPVHVVPGDPRNLKVTVPADLVRAAELLGADVALTTRQGIGHDAHPFGPGSPLRLGGVTFPGVPRLAGHSDGDVVLHAVADALLGAAGLGDLGRWFPAGPETPAGVASTELLTSVVARLESTGWRPVGLDVTVIAARPRLADRLDAMRDATAAALGVPANAVSIKASTGNLAGADGAGRGISALALAVIAPHRLPA